VQFPQVVRALFALAVRADSGECIGMTPAMRLIRFGKECR